MALPASQRIRKKQTFQLIIDQGYYTSGALINLWVYQERATTHVHPAPQLGVMVSRKVSSLATQRNTWKRRISEAFRKKQNLLKSDLSLLIQARKCAHIPSVEEIGNELSRLLKKTNALKA